MARRKPQSGQVFSQSLSVTSLLGIKSPLRFRPHGSNQKAHVVLRRVVLSEGSGDGGETGNIVRYSLFAQKRIEVKPGKEILLSLASPDGPFKDQAIVFEGDALDACASSDEDPDLRDGEETMSKDAFVGGVIPPKMRRAWSRKIEGTESGTKETTPKQVSIGVQVDPSHASTSVQTQPSTVSAATQTCICCVSVSVQVDTTPVRESISIQAVENRDLIDSAMQTEEYLHYTEPETNRDYNPGTLRYAPQSSHQDLTYKGFDGRVTGWDMPQDPAWKPHDCSPSPMDISSTPSQSPLLCPVFSPTTVSDILQESQTSPSRLMASSVSSIASSSGTQDGHEGGVVSSTSHHKDTALIQQAQSEALILQQDDHAEDGKVSSNQETLTKADRGGRKPLAKKSAIPNPFVSAGFMTEFVGTPDDKAPRSSSTSVDLKLCNAQDKGQTPHIQLPIGKAQGQSFPTKRAGSDDPHLKKEPIAPPPNPTFATLKEQPFSVSPLAKKTTLPIQLSKPIFNPQSEPPQFAGSRSSVVPATVPTPIPIPIPIPLISFKQPPQVPVSVSKTTKRPMSPQPDMKSLACISSGPSHNPLNIRPSLISAVQASIEQQPQQRCPPRGPKALRSVHDQKPSPSTVVTASAASTSEATVAGTIPRQPAGAIVIPNAPRKRMVIGASWTASKQANGADSNTTAREAHLTTSNAGKSNPAPSILIQTPGSLAHIVHSTSTSASTAQPVPISRSTKNLSNVLSYGSPSPPPTPIRPTPAASSSRRKRRSGKGGVSKMPHDPSLSTSNLALEQRQASSSASDSTVQPPSTSTTSGPNAVADPSTEDRTKSKPNNKRASESGSGPRVKGAGKKNSESNMPLLDRLSKNAKNSEPAPSLLDRLSVGGLANDLRSRISDSLHPNAKAPANTGSANIKAPPQNDKRVSPRITAASPILSSPVLGCSQPPIHVLPVKPPPPAPPPPPLSASNATALGTRGVKRPRAPSLEDSQVPGASASFTSSSSSSMYGHPLMPASPSSSSPPARRRRCSSYSHNRWPVVPYGYCQRLSGKGDVPILQIAVSSDGNQLAVCCADRSVRVWNNHVPRVELANLMHQEPIVNIAWMNKDLGIMSLGEDGIVGKWTRSAHNQWLYSKVLDTEFGIRSSQQTQDEKPFLAHFRDRIAVSFPRMGVKVWLWKQGTWQPQRSILRQNVSVIRFVEDGAALLGGTRDGVLWHCEVPNGTLRAYAFLKTKITSLDLSPSGTHALVSQADGCARVIDIRASSSTRGAVEQTFLSDETAKTGFGAVFHWAGERVLFGSAESCALVWTRKEGSIMQGLRQEEDDPAQATASVNGMVVTGSRTGLLRWWDS